MKLYENTALPNPRRVRIFMAEKGVDVDLVQVDIGAGAHKTEDFLKKNPYGVVPVLELDDGTAICETISICRYLEEANDGPALMGKTAQEKAVIDMWHKRAEETALGPALAYFHHATEGLGEPNRYRNKDWGEKNRTLAIEGFGKLNAALAGTKYVAGDAFSVADITTLAAVDLAEALGFGVLAQYDNLKAWHEVVSARPSAAA